MVLDTSQSCSDTVEYNLNAGGVFTARWPAILVTSFVFETHVTTVEDPGIPS